MPPSHFHSVIPCTDNFPLVQTTITTSVEGPDHSISANIPFVSCRPQTQDRSRTQHKTHYEVSIEWRPHKLPPVHHERVAQESSSHRCAGHTHYTTTTLVPGTPESSSRFESMSATVH